MPYFSKFMEGPVHGIFATDALESRNMAGPAGEDLEAMTTNHININTGMYFLRHFSHSKRFFEAWFSTRKEGHDQDGFNTMSRSHSCCLSNCFYRVAS